MMYESFAYLYDRLTDDVDYNKFFNYINGKIKKYKPDSSLVLDLACGTGNLTKLLSDNGYDVIGIDGSEDMLNVAREKCPEVLLINQDMTEFELYGTVDAIVCCLDSINYVTDKRKLKKMFSLVKNYLEPGGLFIFDINSKYKLNNIIGNNTFVRNEEDLFYSWENRNDGRYADFFLTFFIKTDNDNYRKFEEVHTERIYDEDEIKKLLADSGLSILDTEYDFGERKVSKKAERIFITAAKF